jgi:hypothetical protein
VHPKFEDEWITLRPAAPQKKFPCAALPQAPVINFCVGRAVRVYFPAIVPMSRRVVNGTVFDVLRRARTSIDHEHTRALSFFGDTSNRIRARLLHQARQ